MEKIERKEYDSPLEEIEDICGVRIICYYLKDIPKIVEILKKEFKIYESFKPEKRFEFDQFGYRSHHIVASINEGWSKVPNYHGLEGLKSEIQTRTVLMHAWAEIEHNLAYKNEAQVPKEFRRKLHRISAKLEEADEQFEELKTESLEYQKRIIDEINKKDGKFTDSISLNLDSLQAFLDTNFKNKRKNPDQTSRLLEEMLEYDLTLGNLQKGWEKIKFRFDEIEKEFWTEKKLSKWTQVGAARIILDLTNTKFRNRHKNKSSVRFKERVRLSKKYTK